MNENTLAAAVPVASASRESGARPRIPRLAYYHANAKGTGGAVKFSLQPAQADDDGCIYMSLARQKTTGSRNGPERVFPTFDWQNRICVRLIMSDITQILQVFRGMTESVGDGKGLYHRSKLGNTVIRMEHRLEPVAGYTIDVNRKPANGGDEQHAYIMLSHSEALGLSLAIEQSMGLIAFGLPSSAAVAGARAEPAAAEADEAAPW